MINLFLAIDNNKSSWDKILENIYFDDIAITAILCGTCIIAITAICVTIFWLVKLSHNKKDKSTKRILKDLLENDQKITELIKEKITVSNAEDVARELLSGTNSDFIKRVSDEVCRLKTKEIIKEELNKMIDKKDSEFIKSIIEKVHLSNNNPQK